MTATTTKPSELRIAVEEMIRESQNGESELAKAIVDRENLAHRLARITTEITECRQRASLAEYQLSTYIRLLNVDCLASRNATLESTLKEVRLRAQDMLSAATNLVEANTGEVQTLKAMAQDVTRIAKI